MSKLLRAGIRCYLHSIVFWICLLVSLCLGVLNGLRFQEYDSLDEERIIAGFLIFTVLISISVGKKYHEGIVRNKVIIGYSRATIFFSELVIAALSTVLCFVLISTPVILTNLKKIECFTTTNAIKMIVGMLLINISVSVISCTICMIFSRKAVAPIICILLILCTFVLSNSISVRLEARKYEFYYEYNQETGEMDEFISKDINPRYIDEPLRTALDIFTNAVPEGQIKEYMDLLKEANGYSEYDYENEKHIPYKLSDEQIKVINTYPYYSLATIFIFSFVGLFVFKKKNLN